MFEINCTNILCHQVAIYTGNGQLEWREGGQLPTPRHGLQAATVDNVIFVTGGLDDNSNDFASILSWDPSTESWKSAGDLKVARSYHAAVAIPSSIIQSECSAIPWIYFLNISALLLVCLLFVAVYVLFCIEVRPALSFLVFCLIVFLSSAAFLFRYMSRDSSGAAGVIIWWHVWGSLRYQQCYMHLWCRFW